MASAAAGGRRRRDVHAGETSASATRASGGTEGTEEGQRGPPPVRVGQDDTRQNTKGALGRGERNPGRGRRIRTGGGQHACELLGSRCMLMGGEVPVQ